MGNCQAVEAAVLVIQHPDGRLERLYWPVSVNEVMRTNPGHHVSLIIPLLDPEEEKQKKKNKKTVRFTRVKLLKPDDTLALGHAYRLIASQDVMKVLRAKKCKKMKQQVQQPGLEAQIEEKNNQGIKDQGSRPKTRTNQVVARSKSWHPSLQSISEAGS